LSKFGEDKLDAVWLARVAERGDDPSQLRPAGADPPAPRSDPLPGRPGERVHGGVEPGGEAARSVGLLCPFAPGVTESAGKKKGRGSTGHPNPYLARVLGEAAVTAGKTDTFLGERYRRIARRQGKKKAIVAVGRSILVIIWHLLSDPDARFTTSARTSTTPASARNPRSATTSANSKPSVTRLPSNPPPDQLPA